VHISGLQPGEQVSEGVQLLLLTSDPYIGYLFYNPAKQKFIEWKMIELLSDSLSLEQAYLSFIESNPQLASWNEPVQIISFTGRQSLVPEAVAELSNLSVFADLQFLRSHEDQLINEINPASNSVQIYAQSGAFTGILNRFFPLRQEHHYFSLLLNRVASEEPVLTLSVFPSQCILTAQMNRKWQLLQTFSFDAKEDFLYYLLQSIQQLGKEPASVQIYLEGLIDKESSLTKLIEQYIPQIYWGRSLEYEYPVSEDYKAHVFSFIDSVLKCVS
jgi:hypothetical protein